MNFTNPNAHQLIMRAAGVGSNHEWTKEFTHTPLPTADLDALHRRVTDWLDRNHVVYPNQDVLVRRCLTSLLVGHVILQGPPGTGKTTLARALAQAFGIHLFPSTATSEWSPFHVVVGLRPNAAGGLAPLLGVVPQAVLDCAERIREEVAAGSGSAGQQATWLLIDEFNRADVDKAMGSLYTLLSSCEPSHLEDTPVDLWFEEDPSNRRLWVPARFRIIGTMNDLDTNYVSAMSQGLRRRFQFITVGVPETGGTPSQPVATELLKALEGARSSLVETFAISVPDSPSLQAGLEKLQRLADGFRRPDEPVEGWPLGTAQVVDVLKSFLITGPDRDFALDEAIAQRVIGQMTMLTQAQYSTFTKLLQVERLPLSERELRHAYRPYTVA